VRVEGGSYNHVRGLKYELIEIGHMDLPCHTRLIDYVYMKIVFNV